MNRHCKAEKHWYHLTMVNYAQCIVHHPVHHVQPYGRGLASWIARDSEMDTQIDKTQIRLVHACTTAVHGSQTAVYSKEPYPID